MLRMFFFFFFRAVMKRVSIHISVQPSNNVKTFDWESWIDLSDSHKTPRWSFEGSLHFQWHSTTLSENSKILYADSILYSDIKLICCISSHTKSHTCIEICKKISVYYQVHVCIKRWWCVPVWCKMLRVCWVMLSFFSWKM